jgi:hypothetical protein
MASNELRRTIKIEKPKKPNNNQVTALITFQKAEGSRQTYI